MRKMDWLGAGKNLSPFAPSPLAERGLGGEEIPAKRELASEAGGVDSQVRGWDAHRVMRRVDGRSLPARQRKLDGRAA